MSIMLSNGCKIDSVDQVPIAVLRGEYAPLRCGVDHLARGAIFAVHILRSLDYRIAAKRDSEGVQA